MIAKGPVLVNSPASGYTSGVLSIATKIKALRERAEWTQAGLAAQLGVSEKTIRRWEAGEDTPRPRIRQALARALGVPVSALGLEE